jgi:hypothetical protein
MQTRSVEAATLQFTGVVGRQTNKARSLFAGEQRANRAMVNLLKATGVSADNTRAGLNSNTSGLADTSKLAISLSSRLPNRSSFGVGNEHPTF